LMAVADNVFPHYCRELHCRELQKKVMREL
jgi:hypothetical protein